MPHYMIQASYTSESWANQLKEPENRIEAIRPAIEKLGGKIESGYFMFGEYDIMVIFEAPDNVSAAAFSLAVSAAGACDLIRTIPLMSIDEGMEAMRKAASSGYRPPD